MKKELKEKIDSIWRPTLYGKLMQAIANEDEKERKNIRQQIFELGYLTLETLENELAEKLVNVFDSQMQIDEYLKKLDKENPELVGIVIRYDLFLQ